MKFKLNRKYKILIALISLMFLLTTIEETYAKYVTSATADTNINISRWNIKINNADIQNNSNFSDSIIPEFLGTDYVNSNIIAPGSEGKFDITIDGTQTDTAYKLNLNIDISDKSDVKDLIITKYTINNDPTEYQYNDTLETTYQINDNKTITYHFYVKWNDNEETETMDNIQDTTAAYNNGKAIMKINLKVTQLIS